VNRLEKMLQARQLLKECGDYDTAIAGAVGEVYAEVMLSMEKAPRGERGYDGVINGRKVQVKGKEWLRHHESASYVAISLKCVGHADDILVVYFDQNGDLAHIGPVDIGKIEKKNTNMREIRYSIKQIRAAWESTKNS
jgi:hypothetical protein